MHHSLETDICIAQRLEATTSRSLRAAQVRLSARCWVFVPEDAEAAVKQLTEAGAKSKVN
eukprot:1158434-Pelagomonas_calceolata.AAC.2